jgi:di/tricarboxylate transporter
MSDSATTALFAPISIALAQALGRAPEPFVVTVAMASVVGFLTPIGHHGNLLGLWPRPLQFHGLCEGRDALNGDLCVDCVLLAPLL